MYNMQSRYYMYTNVVRDKQLKRKILKGVGDKPD